MLYHLTTARQCARALPDATAAKSLHPELSLDTSRLTVDEAVQRILIMLEREGYLR